MTKLFLAAGVAALAIAAPASAERDDKGGARQSAKADRGGEKAQSARAERRGGGAKASSARVERQAGRGEMRTERRNGGGQRMAMMDRGNKGRGEAKIDRRENRSIMHNRGDARQMARADRRDDRIVNRMDRRNDRIENRVARIDGDRFNPRYGQFGRASGLINGCPPGHAKNELCMPPGQYKKMMLSQALPAAYRERVVPLGLRDIYRDNDDYYYRYGDGYMYRVDRGTNLIAALLPLLGGGYSIGQSFPTSYMNSYVPDYYRSFYPDTSDNYYRYANGYGYEIDRGSGLIEDMYPMYGYGYGVGQLMPSSYNYYNVPNQYRDMYYDTDDYSYRYAPGAIYQVDRGSNLITSVASLLTGGMSVGQQLPLGYDAYNVPYAYRDRFYDSQDNWYRYSNGNIYQVDPTTRLVTAVIDAII